MAYKKLPDLTSLTDRQLAELQVEVLERTRKNTGATADLIGIVLLLSVLGAFAAFFAVS